MITAMRKLWGKEKTRLWLEGIQANEPRTYPKNTPTVAAAASGEIDVGFVNHYYLYRFLAEEGEDFGARNYHLTVGGPGSLIMVAGAGILSTSKETRQRRKVLGVHALSGGTAVFRWSDLRIPAGRRCEGLADF